MPRSSNARLGIPLERTVPHRRPGRWMPFVWVLFAAALATSIIVTIRIVIPEAELRPPVVHEQVRPSAAPRTMPQMTVVLAEADSIDFPSREPAVAESDREPGAIERAAPAAREAAREEAQAGPMVAPEGVDQPSEEPMAPGIETAGTGTAPAILLQPAALELRREGRVAGVVYLKAGDQVDVVSHEGGDVVRVRWKDAEGFMGQTALRFSGR